MSRSGDFIPPDGMSAPYALQLIGIEVHSRRFAGGVALRLIVEVRRLRIAALAAGRDRLAPARVSPNSTTATKLLPLVPYIFFVSLDRCARRTTRASPSATR